MNIFHELAEKAFEGAVHNSGLGAILCEFNRYPEEYKFWKSILMFDPVDFYEQMNWDEQALALLFIGEMYDCERTS